MSLILLLASFAEAAPCKIDASIFEMARVHSYALKSPGSFYQGDRFVNLNASGEETAFIFDGPAPVNTVDFLGDATIATEHIWAVVLGNGRVKVRGRSYVFGSQLLRTVDINCEEVLALINPTVESVLSWTRPNN